MSGNIIVVEPESRFKKIDKSLIENPNIDCITLGIYAKIVSFGGKWKLNIKGLSVFLGLSDTKVRKSISLLEKEGYIVRVPIKDEKGVCKNCTHAKIAHNNILNNFYKKENNKEKKLHKR